MFFSWKKEKSSILETDSRTKVELAASRYWKVAHISQKHNTHVHKFWFTPDMCTIVALNAKCTQILTLNMCKNSNMHKFVVQIGALQKYSQTPIFTNCYMHILCTTHWTQSIRSGYYLLVELIFFNLCTFLMLTLYMGKNSIFESWCVQFAQHEKGR